MRSLRRGSALIALVIASTVSEAQLGASGERAILPARQRVGDVFMLQHRADALDRAPRWSLASAPIAVAGGPSAPEYDLTHARAFELLADGRLVTLAGVGSRLLLFGPDGRGERSLARQGRGPGELMAPGGMSRTTGDTLVIPDAGNNRLNWVVAAKGFVRDAPLPVIRNGAFVHPVGVLRTGELVMSTAGLVQTAVGDTVNRPSSSVVVITPGADSAVVVVTLPDLKLLRVRTNYRGRAGFQSQPLRFGPSATAIAWDTVIATGTGDDYRIDLRDATGRVRSSIRIPVARRPVTKAMRDSAIATGLRRFEGAQAERMVDPAESRRLEETRPFADSLPSYGSWFVSPNRTLWVVDASEPGAPARAATAFRQDGALIARLTWAGSGQPVAFGDDRVVMREADADGVVVLRVFRIQPR